MKIEISGKTGDAKRSVRVTIGDRSETMTLGDFSRLLSQPLPMAGAENNVTDLRLRDATPPA